MNPPQLNFTSYFAPFDFTIWILLMVLGLRIFGILKHLSPSQTGSFELFLALLAPLVEIFYSIRIPRNRNTEKVLWAIWFLFAILLVNFYKSFVTNGTVAPLNNLPVRLWKDLLNNTKFDLYSVFEKHLFFNVSYRFNVKNHEYLYHFSRNDFEDDLCIQ